MKTIVVLTDFTEKANHAAEYAFRLAEDLKAQLLLYNTYYLPQAFVAESGAMESDEEHNVYKEQSMQKLSTLAAQLERKYRRNMNSHIPSISFETGDGTFEENLRRVQFKSEILMIVMGDQGSGGFFNNLVFGRETEQTLKNARYPVLLVPEGVHYHSFKKIALALNTSDDATANALNYVTEVARHFYAEVILLHVSPQNGDDEDSDKLLKNFNKIYETINYENITFRNISENKVASALLHYSKLNEVGMICLINKHHAFYEYLTHKSVIKQMMEHQNLPLLIIPGEEK